MNQRRQRRSSRPANQVRRRLPVQARAIMASLINITIASIVAVFGVAEIPNAWLFSGTFALSLVGYLIVEAYLAPSPRARSSLLAASTALMLVTLASVYVYHEIDEPAAARRPAASIEAARGTMPSDGAHFSGKAEHLPPGSTLWLVELDELGDHWAAAPVEVHPDGSWDVKDVNLIGNSPDTAVILLVYADDAVEERLLNANYTEEFLGLPRNRIADSILATREFSIE